MHPPIFNWKRLAFALFTAGYLAFWITLLTRRAIQGEALFFSFLPVLIGPIAIAIDWFAARSTNGQLRGFVGPTFWLYKVFDELHPSYRFVDLCKALERCATRCAEAHALEHASPNATLLMLLRQFNLQPPAPALQNKTCVGFEQHAFLPAEVIWLLKGPPGLAPDDKVVARLSTSYQGLKLEVACRKNEQASVLLKWLADDALAHSIFRGQFIEIRYTRPPHVDYDYHHVSNEMTVIFKPKPGVTDDAIILDDRVRGLLRRNVFDFFAHRDCLHRFGLPLKRALLLYGPPGTGKTHTCRYIHTHMAGATSLLVAGTALARLQDIGQFARQLHPALVVIEDVDLVFSQRDINPYGTALGDLMDQLDGFTPDEEVMFLLTTNAIDRVEQAIRDRPGRINQCLHFDLPRDELRKLFLLQYLRPYDITAVDMDHLVHQTERTSQAFLKEFVLRAVQVAAAAADYAPREPLVLKTAHFDTAFDELTSHGDQHGHAIMGFRVGK